MPSFRKGNAFASSCVLDEMCLNLRNTTGFPSLCAKLPLLWLAVFLFYVLLVEHNTVSNTTSNVALGMIRFSKKRGPVSGIGHSTVSNTTSNVALDIKRVSKKRGPVLGLNLEYSVPIPDTLRGCRFTAIRCPVE